MTGARGFLGSHVVRHHLERGDTVVGVDDGSSPCDILTPLEVASCVITDDADWIMTVHHGSVDRAYHFAAPVGGRTKIERDPLYNADALRLDAMFFDWLVREEVGVGIYPSSSAVYGTFWQDAHGIALHEGLFRPEVAGGTWDAPDELYGAIKLMGEVLAVRAARYGANVLCIRPFSGYGEGQKFEYPFPSICRRAKRHEDPLIVWGSGTQTRDFIHVEDIIGATEALLAAGHEGYWAVNIGSGVPISFTDLAHLAAAAADYQPTVETDTDMPEGVVRRYADIKVLSRYYTPHVSLPDGIARVMESL